VIARIIVVVIGLALHASPASAQTFNSSPSVVGDNAKVSVKYDHRTTNNTVVHKHIVVYEGQSSEQVKAMLESVLAERQQIQNDLMAQREAQAFDAIRAQLVLQLQIAGISLDGLRQQADIIVENTEIFKDILTRPPDAFLGFAAGWLGDSSPRSWTNGGFVRGDLAFVLENGAIRHLGFVSLAADLTKPDLFVLSPSGAELEHSAGSTSWRFLLDVGYEPEFVLGPRLGLAPYLAGGFGAQRFASDISENWGLVAGIRTGAELRLCGDAGFRVGAEYSLQTVRQPTYHFNALEVDRTPERSAQHGVRIYLGGYLAVSRAEENLRHSLSPVSSPLRL